MKQFSQIFACRFLLVLLPLAICVVQASADEGDPCAQFRARAKIIADPLAQPQLFATYERNPDRLKTDNWSSETKAGLSFDLGRFSQGTSIRDLAEQECALWQKREHLSRATTGASAALTIQALQKKYQILANAMKHLEREGPQSQLQGTLEQQDQLEAQILDLKTQMAALDELILRLKASEPSDQQMMMPLTELEGEIARLEREHREFEAQRAKAYRLNRSSLVLSGGTIQRKTPDSVGDQLPYFLSVELRMPISDFLLGSRAESMTAGKNVLPTDSYFTNLRTWLVSRNAEIKRLTLLSDLYRERIQNIWKRLQIIQKTGGAQFMALARSLNLQMSELQAELAYNETLLAGPTAAAAEPEKPKTMNQILVTEGTLRESIDGSGNYIVTGNRVRAKALAAKPSRIEITFRYEGKATTTKNLRSGRPRAQLGCYVAAKNQCNLLYAMWRIEPEPGLVIQKKSNPQQSTHQECENGGYVSVKPSFQKKIKAPEANRSYKLLCDLEHNILTIKIDNEKVWSGTIDLENLDAHGYSGVRSDNVQWQFAVTKEAL